MKNKWMIGLEWGITGAALIWVVVLLMGGQSPEKSLVAESAPISGAQRQR